MSASIHAKVKDGRKVWYVWGVHGEDDKWVKEYPQCASKFDLYETLEKELGLPNTVSRKEIVEILEKKTWDGTRWVDDPADPPKP